MSGPRIARSPRSARGCMRLAIAAAGLVFAGCEDTGTGAICPDVAVPSIELQVVDAATGANLVPGMAAGWVSGQTAGPFVGSDPLGTEVVAYGPPGRYSVIVQHPGYVAWGRDDIRVAPGTCGPRTVSLRAAMVRPSL